MLTIIPLYLISLFASFFATKLIVTRVLRPRRRASTTTTSSLYLPPIDIFYSVVKAVLFAVVVALIHCYYGYYATGGPAGVGVAAGRAIRLSIIAVVILNLVLSLLFWGGQDTARIVG